MVGFGGILYDISRASSNGPLEVMQICYAFQCSLRVLPIELQMAQIRLDTNRETHELIMI